MLRGGLPFCVSAAWAWGWSGALWRDPGSGCGQVGEGLESPTAGIRVCRYPFPSPVFVFQMLKAKAAWSSGDRGPVCEMFAGWVWTCRRGGGQVVAEGGPGTASAQVHGLQLGRRAGEASSSRRARRLSSLGSGASDLWSPCRKVGAESQGREGLLWPPCKAQGRWERDTRRPVRGGGWRARCGVGCASGWVSDG